MPAGGLRSYLSDLSPQARALLLGEFERRVSCGDTDAESSAILQELRALAPAPELDAPAILFFRPLEPFLLDRHSRAGEPGRMARAALPALWQWLADALVPEAVEAYLAQASHALDEGEIGTAEALARALQDRCAAALRSAFAAAEEDGGRALAESIAGRFTLDDLATLRWGLRGRDVLVKLAAALPLRIDEFGPGRVEQAHALIENAIRPREILPLALALLVGRLCEPGQLARLGAYAAGSDSASRIVETAYGLTIEMPVWELERRTDALEDAIGAGDFAETAILLRRIDAGLATLRAEVDIPVASGLGRRLAAISGRAARAGRAALDARCAMRA